MRALWRFAYYLCGFTPVSYSRFSVFHGRIRSLCASKLVKYMGKNVNIEKGAQFGPDLEIGDNSGVGVNCKLSGPISIGKNVMMGPECIIYTTGHNHDRTDIPMIEQGMSEPKPVRIGDDVWIGSRVVILPGVSIGDGSVIGTCAVVTKDIPPYSVAGGVPAKVLKSRK